MAHLSHVLLLCLLATLAGGEPGARQRAEAIVAALEAGDNKSLANHWSENSPLRASGEKRLKRLLDERFDIRLSIENVAVDDARAIALVRIRSALDSRVLLEQYTLELKLENDAWRIVSFSSNEAARADQLLNASADQRDAAVRTMPSTIAVARELLHRGADHLRSGEVEKAQAALSIAADLADRTQHGPTVAAIQLTLGQLASRRRDLVAAVRHYETGLRVAEASSDRRGAAKALHYLATSDRISENYPRAESRWKDALERFRQTDDKLSVAVVLNSLGNTRSMVGDYPGAKARFEESLRLYQELGETSGVASVLNNLGIDERLQGFYDQALDHFRQAVDLSRGIGDLRGVARTLPNVGNVLNAQGDYMGALDAYQQSIALHEKLGVPDFNSLTGVGLMYSAIGNQAQALEYFQKSYEVAEKARNKEWMGASLHNLGLVSAQRGDFARALDFFTRSVSLAREIEFRAGLAIALSDVGEAHSRLGNQEEARASFEKSYAVAEQINDRVTMVNILTKWAEMARRSHDLERALELARRTVTLSSEVGLREKLWQAHLLLGRTYRDLQRPPDAEREIARSIAIVEELRRNIPGEEMAQQVFESRVLPYHAMVALLVEGGNAAAAFEYAERAKARVLLDVMRRGRVDIRGAMTESEREREARHLSQLGQVNRDYRKALVDGNANPALAAEISERLNKARLEYEAFLDAVFAAHPQLRIERGEISPVRATDLRSVLDQSAAGALLEFVVTEEKSYLFVASRDASAAGANLRVHTIDIGQKDLENRVSRFREELAGRKVDYAASARSLYDLLLRPAESQFQKAKVIAIVPEGALWELPFQALQPTSKTFLLDRQALFSAPSFTALREMLARKSNLNRGASTLLAFGNPVISRSVASRAQDVYRDLSLAPVPQTEVEVRRIASHYGAQNSRIHLGEQAREELVKSEAEKFDVLHFATHGLLDDQNALYSRLFFSPSADGSEDGLLEAREIMKLELGADLAVLSACETARGRVGAGEGLIGMSWALFVAGCPNTVVSQWKVSSASTTELMIEFHRALRSDAPTLRTKAEALRRAALRVRSQPAYRHPFYWAAFIVVGRGD